MPPVLSNGKWDFAVTQSLPSCSSDPSLHAYIVEQQYLKGYDLVYYSMTVQRAQI